MTVFVWCWAQYADSFLQVVTFRKRPRVRCRAVVHDLSVRRCGDVAIEVGGWVLVEGYAKPLGHLQDQVAVIIVVGVGGVGVPCAVPCKSWPRADYGD